MYMCVCIYITFEYNIRNIILLQVLIPQRIYAKLKLKS